MTIIFQFNSKSKGKGVPEAIKIAKKHHGKLDGTFYKIEFDSFQENDLIRLYNLIGRLSNTKVIVDGMEADPTQITGDSKRKKTSKKPLSKTKLKWLQEDEIFKTGKHHALQNKIRELYEEAKSFQKEQDFEMAIKRYIKVLRFDHKEGYYFSEALLDIGRLYYLQNNFKKLLKYLISFMNLIRTGIRMMVL